MRKIFIFVLLLLIPVTKIEGACSYSDIARLKKIAANVNASYEYVEKNSQVTFQITLNNLNSELYFIDLSNNLKYDFTKEEITLKNYNSGQTIRYSFYASDRECSDEPLYTLRVTLPKYNEYYTDEICKGIENYSLCQKWSSHNLTYTKFLEKVNEYKKTLIVSEDPIEEIKPSEITFLQLMINFLVDYYIYIAVLIIVLLIVFLAFKRKDDIYS